MWSHVRSGSGAGRPALGCSEEFRSRCDSSSVYSRPPGYVFGIECLDRLSQIVDVGYVPTAESLVYVA